MSLTEAWRQAWSGGAVTTHRVAWLGSSILAGSPDVLDEVLRPWGRAIPVLTVGVSLLIGALALRVVLRRLDHSAVIRALMTLLLVLMLAVGAREPGRIETRYTFFLYLLVMALGLTGIMVLVESRSRSIPGSTGGRRRAGSFILWTVGGLPTRAHRSHHLLAGQLSGRYESPSGPLHYYTRADY